MNEHLKISETFSWRTGIVSWEMSQIEGISIPHFKWYLK